jgi:predicted acetyltransferase
VGEGSSARLVIPARLYLSGYRDALERGWSPDNSRGREAIAEQLEAISADPESFLASLDDPEGRNPPLKMPDGSRRPRLPSLRRWIWDDGLCGSIGLRWPQSGSSLPSHVLGHIGFSIVPWRRRQGHATQALAQMLILARERGLDHVELTTDPDNLASQKAMAANGAVLVERFDKPAEYGGGPALRFRIDL